MVANIQNRTMEKIVLPLLFLGVFVSAAGSLLQLAPAPRRELDYLVVGAVSVMLALLVVFLAVLKNERQCRH